jgi:hypothetical protein
VALVFVSVLVSVAAFNLFESRGSYREVGGERECVREWARNAHLTVRPTERQRAVPILAPAARPSRLPAREATQLESGTASDEDTEPETRV